MTTFAFTITNWSTDKEKWVVPDPLPTVNQFIHNMVTAGHRVGGKDGPGIIAATFKPGTRLNRANLESVTGLILDFDGKFKRVGDQTIPEGASLTEDGKHYIEVIPPVPMLANLPFCGIAHSSHSHGPAYPKFRVIMPLDKPISASEFQRLWFWIYERTQRKADPSGKNPDRMFFLPRCTKDAKAARWPWVRPMYGPMLSLDLVPAEYQIPAEYAYELHRPAKKQGAHYAPPQTNFRSTDARKLLETLLDLPLFDWAVAHAEEVSREVWRGIAINIAAAVLDDPTAHEAGSRAFHDISSCDDARYTHGATEKAWVDALKSAASPGPMTYKTLKLNGAPDDIDEGNARAPVGHARFLLSDKERGLRPKEPPPVDEIDAAVAGGAHAEVSTPSSVAESPDDIVAEAYVDPFAAPTGATTPPATAAGPTYVPVIHKLRLSDYKQSDVKYDTAKNGYIMRKTDPFTGRPYWDLDTIIKDEALNRRLIGLGCPKKRLDDWKQWIDAFDARKAIFTHDDELVRYGDTVYFNTYVATPLQPVQGNWDDIRGLFLHLVGYDQAALEYTLDWVAAPLQKLRRKESPANGHYKNGSTLVFRGDPGAGKGTAMEIIQLCFGLSNCVVLGQDDLDGKFHSNLVDRLFVVGNEVMSSSNRSASTANKLKAWITDPTIPCEGKFADAKEVPNCFNLVLTSNDERPVIIEKGDRRYTVFHSTRIPKHIIQPIRRDLISGQVQVSAFYEAMLARQVSIKYGELYETSARLSVQSASASTSEKFAAAIADDGFLSVAAGWVEGARHGEIREPTMSFNGEDVVLTDTLMTVYRHFCLQMGAHTQHVRALTSALETEFPLAESGYRIRVGGVQRRTWKGIPLQSPHAGILPMPTVVPGPTAVLIPENASDVSFDDVPVKA